MAYSIFFSHSGADKQWAAWIAEAAKKGGIAVYLFEHDPRPGVQIAQKIKVAISSSDALVVLLTPQSQSSAYVQQEIGYAEARDAEAQAKLMIPLRDTMLKLIGPPNLEYKELVRTILAA